MSAAVIEILDGPDLRVPDDSVSGSEVFGRMWVYR